jgi:uncharacterized membrane protein YagU involved in acid resistance
METDILLNTLTIISSIIFLIAVYYSFKLSKETKHEKYWLLLAFGFFVFAIHHWMMIPWSFDLAYEESKEMIENISSIIGALLIGYATFGLYSSMKKVRSKLE